MDAKQREDWISEKQRELAVPQSIPFPLWSAGVGETSPAGWRTIACGDTSALLGVSDRRGMSSERTRTRNENDRILGVSAQDVRQPSPRPPGMRGEWVIAKRFGDIMLDFGLLTIPGGGPVEQAESGRQRMTASAGPWFSAHAGVHESHALPP